MSNNEERGKDSNRRKKFVLKKKKPNNHSRARPKNSILKKRSRLLRWRAFNRRTDLPENAWISPDGQYCNTPYAASYLGRSVSRLQTWRTEGKGPDPIRKGRSVYYRVSDIIGYFEG